MRDPSQRRAVTDERLREIHAQGVEALGAFRAGAMAAWTTAEIMTPRYFGSTVGINVNYLSAAIGEDIFAEGRVLKRGKEIIYSDVRVTNAAGKLLAQGTVTYRIVERAEGEIALPGSKGVGQ